MVNVTAKRCSHGSCFKQPSFGVEGSSAEFCGLHKREDMVNVTAKRCSHGGCVKRALYGEDGSSSELCAEHKKDGMLNVADKQCRHNGCSKIPCFGVEGSRPEYCFRHKSENMVLVRGKTCGHGGCLTRPSFGVEGSSAEFCSRHKRDDMVKVTAKTCSHGSCFKQPSFGVEGSKKREFCFQHKKLGMVNLRRTNQSSAAGKRKRAAREKNDGGRESAWGTESDDSGDEDWLPRNFESNGSTATRRVTRRKKVTSRRPASTTATPPPTTLIPPVSVNFSDEGDGNGTEKGVSSEDLADTVPGPSSYVRPNSCPPVQNGTVAAPVNPMAAASPAPTPALVDALEQEEDPPSKYSTDTDPGASSDVGPRGTIAAPVPTHPLPRHACSVPDPGEGSASSDAIADAYDALLGAAPF